MHNIFDTIDVVLIVLVVFVFWKLWSILGRNTGHGSSEPSFYQGSQQRKSYLDAAPPRIESSNPMTKAGETKGAQPPRTFFSFLRRPGFLFWRKNQKQEEMDSRADIPPYLRSASNEDIFKDAQTKGVIEKDRPEIFDTLEKIRKIDSTFFPQTFTVQAKDIYESITDAFVKMDLSSLKNMLQDNVYKAFEKSIEERKNKSETLERTLICIKNSFIKNMSISDDNKRIDVTMAFLSEMNSMMKNKEGVVIEGDPITIRTMKDLWTFTKLVSKGGGGSWLLSHTS